MEAEPAVVNQSQVAAVIGVFAMHHPLVQAQVGDGAVGVALHVPGEIWRTECGPQVPGGYPETATLGEVPAAAATGFQNTEEVTRCGADASDRGDWPRPAGDVIAVASDALCIGSCPPC